MVLIGRANYLIVQEKISLIELIGLMKQQGSEWKPMVNVDNNNWIGTW